MSAKYEQGASERQKALITSDADGCLLALHIADSDMLYVHLQLCACVCVHAIALEWKL